MDRRAFFTFGAAKAAKVVTEYSAEQARKDASRWVRPPFAIDELDFLLSCTRCSDCADACTYKIIFPLSAKMGAKFIATPALDILNNACHLCEDWPCVNACATQALKFPEIKTNDLSATQEVDDIHAGQYTSDTLPLISKVTINKQACLPYSGPECGACKICPVEGALVWVSEKPEINQNYCTGCGLCREACIVEPKAVDIQSKYA